MESTSSKQKHHHHLVLDNIELDNIELDMKQIKFSTCFKFSSKQQTLRSHTLTLSSQFSSHKSQVQDETKTAYISHDFSSAMSRRGRHFVGRLAHLFGLAMEEATTPLRFPFTLSPNSSINSTTSQVFNQIS